MSKKPALNVDLIYPVGSIYLTTISTNPKYIFGGTWEQIKDTFLLACGDSYVSGSTGGEKEHILTTDEMPKHSHGQYIDRYGGRTALTASNGGGSNIDGYYTGGSWNAYTGPHILSGLTGDDKPHNNMPPYLAVYAWKRIA